jgi:Trypsin-like peptidase domain/Tetratricopeptide Repeats-Sensor
MTAQELSQAIIAAAREYAKSTAEQRLGELEQLAAPERGAIGDAGARALLQPLLNARWFDLAARLGTALRSGGITSSSFTRRWAQALIENRELSKARQVLEQQLAGPRDPEFVEMYGVLGRVKKQQFIEGVRALGIVNAELLRDAVAAYQAGYVIDPERNTWHGINMIACLEYAARRGLVGVQVSGRVPTADDILTDLNSKNALDQWDIGTRAEAYVQKNELRLAAEDLRRYADHPGITAFNIGSTLRQFEEIWELDNRGDGARELLFILRARLTEVENGSVSVRPQDVRDVRAGNVKLEAVFGDARFASLEWFKTAIARCAGVAKIGSETTTRGGTGFLVRGGDLVSKWGDEVLLITNEHVVSETNPEAFARPADARVRFQASDAVAPDRALRIKEVLFTSPKAELDVTIARLDAQLPAAAAMQPTPQLPLADGKGRVLVIGHPEGGDLAFSIVDNALIGCSDRCLHYRAPTEGGSSGSPVFNMKWQLIGLHHGGGDALPRLDGKPGTYQANEGIRLDTIAAAARKSVG